MKSKLLPNTARESLCQNNLDLVLSRLEKVNSLGKGKYLAICPSHDDRSPSLAIKQVDDRILIHCFAGCDTADVLQSMQLEFSDIMPNTAKGNFPREKSPFYSSDVLKTLREDMQILIACALHMSKGFKLCESDLRRLFLASSKIKHAYEVTKYGI